MGRSNKVLIDTNVLIYMYEEKQDIFDKVKELIPQVEFFVLDKIYDEIEKVYKTKPMRKKLLLRYMGKLEASKKFQIIKVPEDVLARVYKYQQIDKLLIYFCNDYLIYTNDKVLKVKIKERRGKVITFKKQGGVVIE